MKKYSIPVFALFIVILNSSVIYAAGHKVPPIIYELLPGGTHIHEGNLKKGLIFLTSEISLLASGILLNNRMDSELNIPLLLAGQVYAIDKCDYSRKKLAEYLREQQYNNRKVRCDTTPLTELMTAPFRREVITSPFVLGWAVLGIVDGIVAYHDNNTNWHDIDHVRVFGSSFNRRGGTVLYETSAAALSWGAAVSEEMLFRGILMPTLDNRFGKRAGLVSSSVIFGLIHLFNSDIDKPVYFVGQATAAGFAFGYQVQRNRYRLDKAVAAHFWYNIVSMTTTWLLNPEENPLRFSVKVAF